MRLNKFIALSGITSRRKADQLILDGEVKVNGKIVTTPGVDITPKDKVNVSGKLIRPQKHQYFIFNKPTKVITSINDPQRRATVADYFKSEKNRLFPVGRLDYETSGLLLITNDGDFANRLMHPSYNKEKTYIAEIDKELSKKEIEKFESGIYIDKKKTAPAKLIFQKRKLNNFRYKIVIHEGRNRQIRKMFSKLNANIKTLKRVQIGSIKLGDLPVGRYRKLTQKEYKMLLE